MKTTLNVDVNTALKVHFKGHKGAMMEILGCEDGRAPTPIRVARNAGAATGLDMSK